MITAIALFYTLCIYSAPNEIVAIAFIWAIIKSVIAIKWLFTPDKNNANIKQ